VRCAIGNPRPSAWWFKLPEGFDTLWPAFPCFLVSSDTQNDHRVTGRAALLRRPDDDYITPTRRRLRLLHDWQCAHSAKLDSNDQNWIPTLRDGWCPTNPNDKINDRGRFGRAVAVASGLRSYGSDDTMDRMLLRIRIKWWSLRSRLTHGLQVVAVGRSLCRRPGLVEAVNDWWQSFTQQSNRMWIRCDWESSSNWCSLNSVAPPHLP